MEGQEARNERKRRRWREEEHLAASVRVKVYPGVEGVTGASRGGNLWASSSLCVSVALTPPSRSAIIRITGIIITSKCRVTPAY